MVDRKLFRRGTGKRGRAGQQFLIDDGQTIQVAVRTELAGERLRGRIRRAGPGPGPAGSQLADEAEIADLPPAGDAEQVLRLDVEVLEPGVAQRVEPVGGVGKTAEQLVPWDAR